MEKKLDFAPHSTRKKRQSVGEKQKSAKLSAHPYAKVLAQLFKGAEVRGSRSDWLIWRIMKRLVRPCSLAAAAGE